jgi:hypothetical protein
MRLLDDINQKRDGFYAIVAYLADLEHRGLVNWASLFRAEGEQRLLEYWVHWGAYKKVAAPEIERIAAEYRIPQRVQILHREPGANSAPLVEGYSAADYVSLRHTFELRA